MYAATLPSDKSSNAQNDPTPLTGMRGRAELGFAHDTDQTRLKHLYHASPFRVLFPTLPKDELTSAVLVTTSGGLVGGDRLDVDVRVRQNAHAHVMGQAAEKVYRSTGPDTHFNANLNVEGGGYLEWLPQETIVFDQARLRRTTRVDVASNATFSGAEMLVFGRIAMGETIRTGLIRDVWDVRREGRQIWADALHLDGDIQAKLNHPAGFDGATAVATFVHIAPDAADRLDLAREILGEGSDRVRSGATVINGVLLARWLAFDARAMRESFGHFWAAFRAHTQNLPERMPRLWHV